MKFFNNYRKITIAAAMLISSIGAPALAHDGPHADGITHQAPSTATISAVRQGDGYVISWTEPLDVSTIEIYFNPGERTGYVGKVNVGAAKSIQLPSNAKRFNLVATDGKFLHIECGGNDRTTMPTLQGVSVDCSYIDGSGHAAGALVITS